MDGTIGEIRVFAGNFVPVNWLECDGSPLNISDYQALFSIIEFSFGGNESTIFNIPDLRGRTIIGRGNGREISVLTGGVVIGAKQAVLTTNNMPTHNHTASIANSTVSGTASGSITPKCCSDAGDQNSPQGNFWAGLSNGYALTSDATDNMASIQASLNVNGSVSGNITVNNNGSGIGFDIVQPSMALRWIICTNGLYPSRN